MSLPTKSKTFVVKNQPTGDVVLEGPSATWELVEQPLPEVKDGQVLTKLVYVSNDPAQRGWMDANIPEDRHYVPPIKQGDAMRAIAISKVVASKSPDHKEGDLVRCVLTWSEYHVVDAKTVQPIRSIPGISDTHFLGALGGTGMTAYAGLIKVGEAKQGETIVVSGAAGATGSMVVQIAKHIVGAKKIIGLAGSDDKCRWVESIGADKCINYKGDWKTELSEAFKDSPPNVFFDNVGGEQLDFMLTKLATHGRVVACGAIADYNAEVKSGLTNWFQVIIQRLQLRGFIVTDHMRDFPQIAKELVEATKAGKIKMDDESETVVDTKFEDIPKTWLQLFEGGNRGKLVTKLV